MRIKRKGFNFYYEVFYPIHQYKFMGKIITISPELLDTDRVFLIHFKKPELHFYIKEQGYPINEELLQMLYNGNIKYVLIPEDGKTGFKVYIADVKTYLNGSIIKEPHTEQQRCIPLRELKQLQNINKESLRKILYVE